MSRRARKYHPKPVHSNAVQIALARVKPLTAADVAGQTALVQNALQQFCQGINCDAHWCSLAGTANMAETLAGMGLGSGPHADAVIERGQQALAAVHQRRTERGTWTLYPTEIDDLHWLVALHCRTQLPATSYGELETALDRTRNRIAQARAGNASPGAIVLSGNFHPEGSAA